MKRAVKFSFLDYSTAEKRREMAEREVAVNRRTAPALYLGTEAVVRRDGRLAFGGEGEPVEWVVVMKRFSQEDILDHIAESGGLTGEMMDELADAVAAFHQDAAPAAEFGGASGLDHTFSNTWRELERFSGELFAESELVALRDAVTPRIEHHAGLLNARKAAGQVRACHGDMHLGNICLVDGRPTPFDAIEFSERIANSDVLYDLAFALMDLIRFGRADFANRVMNRYLETTRDYAGLAPMPLFLAIRASIRAMATALTRRQEKAGLAKTFFRLAFDLLKEPDPRLIAIGGLSGSGKTTVARAIATRIAPGAGAVHLRSDTTRKRLYGVAPEVKLPEDAYTEDVSTRVFARMHEDARTALKAGQTVILDATHMSPQLRDAVEDIAWQAKVPFHGIWLDAPLAKLTGRAESRAADASDAAAAVVRAQAEGDLGDITWPRADAGREIDAVVAHVLQALKM